MQKKKKLLLLLLTLTFLGIGGIGRYALSAIQPTPSTIHDARMRYDDRPKTPGEGNT